MLHLPPLTFHCVGGCLEPTQDCCDFDRGIETLYHSARSHTLGKISSVHQSNLCNFVGVVLEAHKRIQVNVHLKASLVTGFENVQEVKYYLLFIFIMFITVSQKFIINFFRKTPSGQLAASF
jgi:hypothetical protein